MVFSELRSTLDKQSNAFVDWESVAESKERRHIPEIFWDMVPDTCECGSEMIVTYNQRKTEQDDTTNNLRRMQCCDPYCPIKMGIALSEVITGFQIKNFGDATGIQIYKEFLEASKWRKKQYEKDLPRLTELVDTQQKELEQLKVRCAELEQTPSVIENLEHFQEREEATKLKEDLLNQRIEAYNHNRDTTQISSVIDELTDWFIGSDKKQVELKRTYPDCKEYIETLDRIKSLEQLLEQNRISLTEATEQPGVLPTGSFLDVLLVPYEYYPASLYGTVKGQELSIASDLIRNTELTFAQMVRHLKIPSVDSKALVLFKGINSSKEFCSIVESYGGLRNFCYVRGIYDSTVLFWLSVSIRDIFVGEYLLGPKLRQ